MHTHWKLHPTLNGRNKICNRNCVRSGIGAERRKVIWIFETHYQCACSISLLAAKRETLRALKYRHQLYAPLNSGWTVCQFVFPIYHILYFPAIPFNTELLLLHWVGCRRESPFVGWTFHMIWQWELHMIFKKCWTDIVRHHLTVKRMQKFNITKIRKLFTIFLLSLSLSLSLPFSLSLSLSLSPLSLSLSLWRMQGDVVRSICHDVYNLRSACSNAWTLVHFFPSPFPVALWPNSGSCPPPYGASRIQPVHTP